MNEMINNFFIAAIALLSIISILNCVPFFINKLANRLTKEKLNEKIEDQQKEIEGIKKNLQRRYEENFILENSINQLKKTVAENEHLFQKMNIKHIKRKKFKNIFHEKK